MLHQPASQFADQPSSPPALDTEDRPSFDAQGYIAAMRAAGAMFTPNRGEPGHGLRNGTFTIEPPPNPADRHRMVAVEEEFAARRAADPSADGAIAYCVFEQHSEARFARVVRGDFDIALRELARLKHRQEVCAALEDDPDDDDRARAEATEAADIATMDYFVAVDHVLAMPVRCERDTQLQARCAFLHGRGEWVPAQGCLAPPASPLDRRPSSTPIPDSEDQPIFDAAAYIDAMRAVGAKLEPIRGAPGQVELNGTFAVEKPSDAARRQGIAAIEAAFAPQRAADPAADGRVAQALFSEAARQRFETLVGSDFGAALQELARLADLADVAYGREMALDDRAGTAPDEDEVLRAADIASEQYQEALDYVTAMPIQSSIDIALKAEFAVRYCSYGSELQAVLQEIVAFGLPERGQSLVPKPLTAS